MVINLPMRNGGARRVSSFMTHGYRTRRLAVDYSIPLVTDVKCAKLLVEAMRRIGGAPAMQTQTDCMTSRRMVRLPGFIDVHVHLRVPGAPHKEDFDSGTAAALAGGVTMVLAMPNTNPAIIDRPAFQIISDLARQGARCDYGLYVGASSDNFDSIHELAPQSAALKMYLNQTFSTLQLNDMTIWQKHFSNWPRRAPLVVHAEKQTMAAAILLASITDRPIHVAHVARREEVLIIREAKNHGIKITCEVCPHHLFLSTENIATIGSGRAEVRPVLCLPEDQQALWDNMDVIDVFATDHAPHTPEEKSSANPPPGFPGLETILPLLLNAVSEGRLTLDDVIAKFHRNPRKIFNLPEQPNTYVEVDLDEEWEIPTYTAYSKAKWTPFAGQKVKGCIHRVVLRGEVAFIDGEVLVPAGFGENIRDWPIKKTNYHQSLENLNSLSEHVDKTTELLQPRSESVSDHLANDVFSKLLGESTAPKLAVHFAASSNNEKSALRPMSPMPARVRCDSTSNTKLLRDLVLQTTDSSAVEAHLHGLSNKHVLSVDMFTKEQLNDIFDFAQIFKGRVAKDRPIDDILKGKIMASVFYEVSTRTSGSFAAAMQRLGGRVITMDESSSSVQKGETLEDSISVLAGYADVIVLRHPEPGAVAVSIFFGLETVFLWLKTIYFLFDTNSVPLSIVVSH